MKILKSTTGTTYRHATLEDAQNCIEELTNWTNIYGVHIPHDVRLYDIPEDFEDEETNIEPIAHVVGFAHDEMTDRDDDITEDEDADITTIITDNARDAIYNDYDGRFAEFLANFKK